MLYRKKFPTVLVLLILVAITASVSVAANSSDDATVNRPVDIAAQTTTLEAAAQCVGPDLEITISAGDGPFDVLVDSAPPGHIPLNDVPAGVYTSSGPGTWTIVRVIEQSGDSEVALLGNFTCEVPTITLTSSWTPTNTATNTVQPTATSSFTDTPTAGTPPSVTPSLTPTGSITPLPDLYVQMVMVELENGTNCEEGLGYSVWIHNGGNADAGPFNVLINNSLTVPAPGVAAGQTLYLWKEGNIYHATQVLVEVDSDNDVVESDESNNTFNEYVPIPTLPTHCLWTDTPSFTPTPSGTPPTDTPTGSVTLLPDLFVENVRIELEYGTNCEEGLGTSVWIHNGGNADAGPFDVLVNGMTVSAASVDAGLTVYVWAPTVMYPGMTTVEVDSNDDIAESDETNNTFSEYLPVPTLPSHCLWTDTPTDPTSLVASGTCVAQNLVVTITAGDGPFDITSSGGGNTPVNGVSVGSQTFNGPDKWDDLTVTENGGDTESINLGQFKCRTDERPVPLSPAHRSRTTDPFPVFSWTSISIASNYRVFVFDNKVAADRTVDIRENSGGPTTKTLTTPLPDGRLFWRVRGRQNRVWSLWSIRFTLFKEPAVAPVILPPPLNSR